MTRNGAAKKPTLGGAGYMVYQRSEKNKTSQKYLHRILLEAFVGPCPDGCEALHINGNRTDNRLENLRWGTRKENVADAMSHGTATVGAKNKQAKLTEVDVRSVRRLSAKGWTQKQIADRFGVNAATISNVVRGATYQGVTA